MKKMIAAMALAGGAALATTVVAQTGMRVGPSAASGQGMASAEAAEIAVLKNRLNADEAAMSAMKKQIDQLESKTGFMYALQTQANDDVAALKTAFSKHRHPIPAPGTGSNVTGTYVLTNP